VKCGHTSKQSSKQFILTGFFSTRKRIDSIPAVIQGLISVSTSDLRVLSMKTVNLGIFDDFGHYTVENDDFGGYIGTNGDFRDYHSKGWFLVKRFPVKRLPVHTGFR
jgi:hypothetical protein